MEDAEEKEKEKKSGAEPISNCDMQRHLEGKTGCM